MISTSVKTFSFIIVTLALCNDVLCETSSKSLFRLISKSYNSGNSTFSNDNRISTDSDNSVLTEDRIVGGQYARINQFPFMAVIHRLMGHGLVSQCGGTIISPRWILTAGHCVAPEPRLFFIVLGVNDKSGMGYNFYHGPGLAMMSDKGIVHPGYRPSINDIGLIKMPINIPFSEKIQPIQLAGFNEYRETFANRLATVVGWGKDGNSGTGTIILKYATVPVISNSVCGMSWDITNKHVCSASNYGQDACQGDSGGPLLVFESGVPLQIGIVSYGDAYCPSNKPGVFTRLTAYIDWIQEVTEQYF